MHLSMSLSGGVGASKREGGDGGRFSKGVGGGSGSHEGEVGEEGECGGARGFLYVVTCGSLRILTMFVTSPPIFTITCSFMGVFRGGGVLWWGKVFTAGRDCRHRLLSPSMGRR
jgi:hypothetical protein